MSRLNVGNLFNENEDGAPVVSGISTFSSPHYFVPPSGTTAQRPQNPGEGMIRFNTDSGHLEYYTGTHWADVITNNNELGDTNNTNSSGGTGTRGVLMGGGTPTPVNEMDYITVDTLGNSQDFGDLTSTERGSNNGQAGSRVKGLAMGGNDTGANVESITFASTGSAVNHGNLLTTGRRLGGGASNQTRALYAGGMTPVPQNNISAVDIASTGSSEVFGSLSTGTYFASGVASSVRGVFSMGRESASPHYYGEIEYVTISSQGNSQDFGDLNENQNPDGAGNSIRGIFSGGSNPTYTNFIDFLTIATTGDAQDFGDLTVAKAMAGAVSSPTRYVTMAGRNSGGSMIDEMDYVTIMTTGNAISFGEITGSDRFRPTSASNGHGGL